jgi:ABC-type sulfate/molybdate transport systems ATPase subunit
MSAQADNSFWLRIHSLTRIETRTEAPHEYSWERRMDIQVKNLSKTYGAFHALRDVTVDIPQGELVALLGPSGSGKTTLLRIIAGLEAAEQGSVLYHNNDVTRRSARERNVGFVFQHYALFAHLNIYETSPSVCAFASGKKTLSKSACASFCN